MAKTYRTLKFTYNAATITIDVLLSRETPSREDIEIIRQAMDGTRYHFVTGYKRIFVYSYSYAELDIYEFFLAAFTAFRSGVVVTFEREADDGSFDSFEAIVKRPQFNDETVGETDKIYKDLSVEILEI